MFMARSHSVKMTSLVNVGQAHFNRGLLWYLLAASFKVTNCYYSPSNNLYYSHDPSYAQLYVDGVNGATYEQQQQQQHQQQHQQQTAPVTNNGQYSSLTALGW